MRLIRLHIENFGKLQNFDFSFDAGINILLKENGWGKSTLAAFIKAMLYGMPASTKHALDENERKKYMPWQGGAYGGSLELSTSTGKYRIERFFGAKESGDSFVLYDLATNCESTRYSSRIGEELFGIDADGFARTVYFSQHAILAKGDNNTITAKLGNLLDDVDDIGNFDDAMATLDKRRKYYKMAGEKGRIVQIERELADLRTQTEQLTRTEDAMRQKERELVILGDRIKEITAAIEGVREKIRRAAVAREQAALIAQKERMERELSTLEESARSLDARMGGRHPTPEEIDEKRRVLENIYKARARATESVSMATQLEKYEILNPDFAGTLPDKEDFATMLSANLELQNMIHREEGLSAPALSSATRLFDRQTPPTEAEIKGILNALAAEEAARVAQQEKKGKGKRTLAILCLAIAVLLLLAGVFVSPVLIAASAVFGIIALVLFLRAPKNDSSNPAFPAALAAKEMLSRYGLSTEGNLRDRLTELTLLSRQWREGEEAEQKRVKTLQSLRAKKQQLLRTLQEKFRTWDILLPPKNDYRDDIEALRRDVSRVKRSVLETEERGRRRRAALDEQKRLQGELTPFLRHFDPKTTMKPSECLDRVREWETEYRRLSHRIPELRAELSRFVAEKRLLPDAVQGDISLPNVSVLNARESALHKELAEAQSHQAELKSHIGRLAIDVERLPEIEATVRALEEEYTIACANSETIANTARFLEEAKQGLSTRYLDNMHTSFSALLKALMDGESPETVLDPSFKVKLRQNGRTHPTEVLSQGWRDAVEFCIRLSLAEALYEDGEIPPIILDDPFVNLDERRLEAAKRLLVALSGKYQILYLICHSERR